MTKECTRDGILMHQVHEPELWVHWTSIKIEAQVYYFVTILEHKVFKYAVAYSYTT